MNYPVEIRKTSKGALSAIMGNVETEEPALNALLDHAKVSSGDLLDVYTELIEVAFDLDAESTNNVNWGDQKLGTDLAQLEAKARLLSAKLGVTLRSQIAAQELQLASCMQKTPSHQ